MGFEVGAGGRRGGVERSEEAGSRVGWWQQQKLAGCVHDTTPPPPGQGGSYLPVPRGGGERSTGRVRDEREKGGS